jgi:hypothetical protein
LSCLQSLEDTKRLNDRVSMLFERIGSLSAEKRKKEILKLSEQTRLELLKVMQMPPASIVKGKKEKSKEEEEEEEDGKKGKKKRARKVGETFTTFYAEIKGMMRAERKRLDDADHVLSLPCIRNPGTKLEAKCGLDKVKAYASQLEKTQSGFGQLMMVQSIEHGRCWTEIFDYWDMNRDDEEFSRHGITTFAAYLEHLLGSGHMSERWILELRDLYNVYLVYPNIALVSCSPSKFIQYLGKFKECLKNKAEAREWRLSHKQKMEINRTRKFQIENAVVGIDNAPVAFFEYVEDIPDEDEEEYEEKRARISDKMDISDEEGKEEVDDDDEDIDIEN